MPAEGILELPPAHLLGDKGALQIETVRHVE